MRLWVALGFILSFLACAPPSKVRMLTSVPPEQKQFLKEKLLPAFERKHKCKVELVSYSNEEELFRRLLSKDTIYDLIEAPNETTPALIRAGQLAELNPILGTNGWENWRKEFFLTELSRVGSQHFLLPRFIETKVLLYSKSKVSEAQLHWKFQRSEIDSILRRYNQKGLPLDYQLEENPAQWDFFDLFTLGWYWKSHESQGAKRGRIFCPSGESNESALALWDQGFRLGADTASLMRMHGPGVHELFQWQAIFSFEGLCQPIHAKSNTLSNPISLFQSGETFLSEVYPRDYWRIHGNASSNLPFLSPNPDDFGVTTLSKGQSIQLGATGLPLREGQQGAATRIWWLAIPKQSQAQPMALLLASYLSSAKIQVEECAGFGLIPARKDLLADLNLLVGAPWMEEAYRAATQQLLANRYVTGPRMPEFMDIAKLYTEAYQTLCAHRTVQSKDEIHKVLEHSFSPRAIQILRETQERQLSQNP